MNDLIYTFDKKRFVNAYIKTRGPIERTSNTVKLLRFIVRMIRKLTKI